jgi:hypothetical protein
LSLVENILSRLGLGDGKDSVDGRLDKTSLDLRENVANEICEDLSFISGVRERSVLPIIRIFFL